MKESANLCQRVYDYVREEVMSLRLHPGEKITETMLVEELNISRTPIREGMRMLAQDGVITLYPNRFAEITTFSQKDIYDLGAIRIALDILGSRLAVFHGSNADFSRLEKLAQACAAAMSKGNFRERAQMDSDFHLALMEISGNSFLYEFQKTIYSRVQMIQVLRFSQTPTSHFGGASHEDIVEALFARDEARVTDCIKSHLINFYQVDDTLPQNFFDIF